MHSTFLKVPLLPTAWGDVFDKMTILQIKAERISAPAKRINIEREQREVERIAGDPANFPAELQALLVQLKFINTEIWNIEEGKREAERNQVFDERFIHLARQVCIQNDLRAALKRKINILLDSALIEEKSHSAA